MTGSVEVALDGVRLALDPGAGPCRIVLDGDRIAEVRPSTVDRGLLAAPGYIDLQVNGAVGVDLATEPERLDEVARALPRFGVTAFAPTAITCSPEATRRALAAAAPHDADTSGGATHLGWHLEGPFLSPARVGAHSLRHIRPKNSRPPGAAASPSSPIWATRRAGSPPATPASSGRRSIRAGPDSRRSSSMASICTT